MPTIKEVKKELQHREWAEQLRLFLSEKEEKLCREKHKNVSTEKEIYGIINMEF